VFIKLKEIKNSFWFQSNTTKVCFIFILTTCFSLLTIIRPSLQHLESGACSANSTHLILRFANIADDGQFTETRRQDKNKINYFVVFD
jgi:hypothetical protein